MLFKQFLYGARPTDCKVPSCQLLLTPLCAMCSSLWQVASSALSVWVGHTIGQREGFVLRLKAGHCCVATRSTEARQLWAGNRTASAISRCGRPDWHGSLDRKAKSQTVSMQSPVLCPAFVAGSVAEASAALPCACHLLLKSPACRKESSQANYSVKAKSQGGHFLCAGFSQLGVAVHRTYSCSEVRRSEGKLCMATDLASSNAGGAG